MASALIFLSAVPEEPRSRLSSSVLPGNLRVVTGEVLVDHVGHNVVDVCLLVGILPVIPGRILLSRLEPSNSDSSGDICIIKMI